MEQQTSTENEYHRYTSTCIYRIGTKTTNFYSSLMFVRFFSHESVNSTIFNNLVKIQFFVEHLYNTDTPTLLSNNLPVSQKFDQIFDFSNFLPKNCKKVDQFIKFYWKLVFQVVNYQARLASIKLMLNYEFQVFRLKLVFVSFWVFSSIFTL